MRPTPRFAKRADALASVNPDAVYDAKDASQAKMIDAIWAEMKEHAARIATWERECPEEVLLYKAKLAETARRKREAATMVAEPDSPEEEKPASSKRALAAVKQITNVADHLAEIAELAIKHIDPKNKKLLITAQSLVYIAIEGKPKDD